jgi:hypothetical protein
VVNCNVYVLRPAALINFDFSLTAGGGVISHYKGAPALLLLPVNVFFAGGSFGLVSTDGKTSYDA